MKMQQRLASLVFRQTKKLDFYEHNHLKFFFQNGATVRSREPFLMRGPGLQPIPDSETWNVASRI